MPGPLTPASLTTLAFFLAVPVAPMTAQEPQEAFGIYDDWSVHRLQDGDLRVCYAETRLVSSREVENGLGDVRLQVTSRSLSGSSDMIRVSPTSVFSSSGSYAMIDTTLAFRVDALTPMEFDHTSVVNQMKASEASKGEMVLWRDSDSTSAGVFSLRGFTTAYNSVGQLCPAPQETRAATRSISVSDVSVEWWPAQYSEFNVTGPFFRMQQADRIKIRAVPSEFAEFLGFTRDTENGSPPGAFTYGSQRLEFYHEGALIDSLAGGAHSNRVEGACLDPKSGLLKVVMHNWDGGATDPGTVSVVYFGPDKRIIAETVSWYGLEVPMLLCSEGESSWQWGAHFTPCLCVGRAAGDAYSTTMNDVVGEIRRINRKNGGAQTRIDRDAFSSLLAQISRIEPFTEWDATSSLDVQRFESPGFTVVAIAYRDYAYVSNSVQTTYVRRRDDVYWIPVFSEEGSLKAFNPLKIHGFIDDNTLEISKCAAWCDSPEGTYRRVTRNVAEWRQDASNGR